MTILKFDENGRVLQMNRKQCGKGRNCSLWNFRLFQTERVCRWQFWNLMKMAEFSNWTENSVGKEEIAHYEQFLLFPQCFQKTCTADTYQAFFWERIKYSLHDVFCIKPWSHRANGRVTDKKSFYLYISVLCSFLIRWIRSLSGDVRWCPFRPVLSFEHVQNFPPDKTDRDARLMYGHYVA